MDHDNEREGLLSEPHRSWATPTKLILAASILIVIISIAVSVVLSVQLGKLNQSHYTSSDYEHACQRFEDGHPREKVIYDQKQIVYIYNANIYVDGEVFLGHLKLSNGLIESVIKDSGEKPRSSPSDIVINANRGFVTPGLIDIHSHGGSMSTPFDAQGNSDTNEMTNPTFPAVRVIDAFNPHDSALPDMVDAGLTTIQTLPGSGNVMGGQGVLVKLRGNTVEEMRIKDAPISLKMACGENPKRIYGNKNVTPMSRMGSGYKMRNVFAEASRLYRSQKDYCSRSHPSGAFPDDLFYTNIIELMRGNAVLNIHCYKVVDFEMAMRVTEEFGISIDVFHHAHEAYKIPQELKARNISVALFSDSWGYKLEAYETSLYDYNILDKAGVNVVIKTDHPVIRGSDLLFQAQKAARWGLNPKTALNAVTSNAAKAIKMDHRMGSLVSGKEADVVIWDRHPLHFGAKPTLVLIEGQIVRENAIPVQSELLEYTSPEYHMTTQPTNVCEQSRQNDFTLPSYHVTSATVYTGSRVLSPGQIYVRNGQIECVDVQCAAPNDVPRIQLNEGHITPGLILAGLNIGLVEIDQEGTWSDGPLSGGLETSTLHGITLDTKHTHTAWKDGIFTGIARPRSSKMLSGSSSAFNMGPGIRFLTPKYIVNERVAVDIVIGNNAKSDIVSVSDQIYTLRNEFKKAEPGSILHKVIEGEVPVIFWVNSADYMLSILRVLEEVLGNPEEAKIRIVFGGAAEIHLIADRVKAWNASVLLNRCNTYTFETRRCDYGKNIETLSELNILFGLTPSDEDNSFTRGILFEAARAKEFDLTDEDAIRTVSTNIATILELPNGLGEIKVGQTANFVGYTGNPLSSSSMVEFLAIHDKIECKPIEEI